MVEHLLCIIVGKRGCLDAQIAEHGVGLPATKELDGVLVDTGAEQGGGAPGSERPGADERHGNAGLTL